MYQRFLFRLFVLILTAMGTNTFLFAECWAPHTRPLNSTEPRDSSVPEIPGGKTLTITILDDAGKPIPQAKFGYFGDPKPHPKDGQWHYVETDANGQFVIRFKPDTEQKSLQIEVDQPGFAPYNATWDAPKTDPIPEAFTIQLEKAIQIGGIVHDENGKPYPGADVTFRIHWQHRSRVPQICSYGVWTQTDANGVWTCNLVPPKMLDKEIAFHVHVEGYMPFEQTSVPLSSFLPDENGKYKHVSKLDRGLTVQGRITDEDGKPIADAVVFGNYMQTREDTLGKTDENGEFTLLNWPESENAYIGVWAAGKKSVLHDFKLKKDNVPTINLVMKKAGKPIKIKIVDKHGKPVPGFMIAIERWGSHRLVNSILLAGKQAWGSTNQDGIWTWNEAPENEVVFDMMKGSDWMDIRDKTMIAQDEEYVFTAAAPLEVSGKVLDAETSEPIPTFKVSLGFKFENSNEMYWELKPNSGKDGSYLVGSDFPRPSFGVKIEVAGCEPGISREIAPDEGKITIDFKMQKLSAEKLANSLKGTVLTPDGKPAARASVALATPKRNPPAMFGEGKFQHGQEPYLIETDENGHFQFSYFDFEEESESSDELPDGVELDKYALFIAHDFGYKKITPQEMETLYCGKPITLDKWGRIEGTVKLGTQPGPEIEVFFLPKMVADDTASAYALSPGGSLRTKSDENGKFTINFVPLGFGIICRRVPSPGGGGMFSDRVHDLVISSGETTTVQIGGVGRPVVGKLVLGEGIDKKSDMKNCTIDCRFPVEPLPQGFFNKMRSLFPANIRAETDAEKRAALYKEWIETDTGKEYKKMEDEQYAWFKRKSQTWDQMRYATALSDGTFRVDNIPEEEWELEIKLLGQSSGGFGWGAPSLGTVKHRFTMPSVPGGVSDEPFDVGTLTLEKTEQEKPLLQVGQTAPDFELPQIHPNVNGEQKPETSTLKLSNYRGKYVILDFWATWCGPCLAKLPELQKFYRSIEGDPEIVMIAISLDNSDEAEMVSKFVAKREMPWLHVLAGNWGSSPMLKDYGVSSIPALLLIDKDGKVILSNPKVEELKRKIGGGM